MIQNTQLLTRAAMAGNRDAFGELVEQHYPLIRGVAFRRVGDWDVSEDLAQETLLAAHANLDQLRDSNAFPAWLCRIARNLSANWIRSEQYRRELAKRYKAERGTRAETSDNTSEDFARREHIRVLLEQLPPKLREALVIFYLEEHTAPEAARVLGIPENTFYNRVHRARKRMRELVEQDIRETVRPDSNKLAKRRLLSVLPLLPVMPSLAQRAAATGPGLALVNLCLQTWTGVASVGGKSAFAVLVFVVVTALSVALWSRQDSAQTATPNETSEATIGDKMVPASTDVPSATPSPAEVSVATVGAITTTPPALKPVLDEGPQQVGTVSGHVYHDDVLPLEGAKVIVYAPGTEWEELTQEEREEFFDPMWGSIVHPESAFHAFSDAEGFFKITRIPSVGDARINVYHKGFIDGGAYIELSAGGEIAMDLTLERREFVAGVLLSESGAPVTDAKVHVVQLLREDSAGSGGIQAGYTDQSGEFHLPVGLKSTERAVAIIMAKSKTLGNALFEDIDVCPEDSITLRYPNRTSLRGNVTVVDDASAIGFQVRLEGRFIGFFGERYDLQYWNESTEVIQDGSYEFNQLDPEPIYEIKVFDLNGREVALDRDFLELRPTASNTVNLRVEESAWVSGRVYGVRSRQPIPNVWVRCKGISSAEVVSYDSSRTAFTAETDSEGNYRIEILRGWGAFQIMADYGRDKNFGRTAARLVEELEIRPGGKYNVNLSLPTPWSRSFLVQDGDGNPLPDVGVQLDANALDGLGGGSYSGAKTDSEGRLTLSSLDPDYELAVQFQKEGYMPVKTEHLRGRPGESFPIETIVLLKVSDAVAKLVNVRQVAFANRTVDIYLYSDGVLGLTMDVRTDEHGFIRRDPQFQIADLLPTGGEISFELEIQDPAVDGQAGAIYRSSNHLLLPEDETQNMGTIVLEKVEVDASQPHPSSQDD